MKLVKYRDAGMHTYTFFYIDEEERIASPYFDSESQAEKWLAELWDNWKPSKDVK
jgi:hypothetical protein